MVDRDKLYRTWLELGGQDYLPFDIFQGLFGLANDQAGYDLSSQANLTYDPEQQQQIDSILNAEDMVDGLLGIASPPPLRGVDN